MLKGEFRGEHKKRPLGKPLIQGVLKKSSSPVQTATRKRKCLFIGFLCFFIVLSSTFLPHEY